MVSFLDISLTLFCFPSHCQHIYSTFYVVQVLSIALDCDLNQASQSSLILSIIKGIIGQLSLYLYTTYIHWQYIKYRDSSKNFILYFLVSLFLHGIRATFLWPPVVSICMHQVFVCLLFVFFLCPSSASNIERGSHWWMLSWDYFKNTLQPNRTIAENYFLH